MHEISLVRSIFNTLETEFSKEELETITAIDLKIGLLSNIEPLLMQNAFEAVTTAENKFLNVKLNVEPVPVEIHCNDCNTNSVIKNYKFVCNSCGTPNNNVVKGLELLIHQVHFDSPKKISS
ncbi:MAG TPA: hydrogenase maturation nickel metallochaperone HypA [Phaeodactylibacter sp.]|nr:hydrogenase maturation nickel metallochaperone HypA [Phaeodactylibacter sp.]